MANKVDQHDAKLSKKVPFSFPFQSFAVSRFDDDAQGSTRLYINVNWVKKCLTKVFKIFGFDAKTEFI